MNIFHKFFKVSSQTSFTLQKVAEHVSSFPSAAGEHRLAIFIYGWLQIKWFVPNFSMNNRRALSIDTSSWFCLQVCTKPKKIRTNFEQLNDFGKCDGNWGKNRKTTNLHFVKCLNFQKILIDFASKKIWWTFLDNLKKSR